VFFRRRGKWSGGPDLGRKSRPPKSRALNEGREVKRARKAGAADGKRGVPGPTDTVCFPLEVFKQRAEAVMDDIAQAWNRRSADLHGEWSKLLEVSRQREAEIPPLAKQLGVCERNVATKQKAYDARRAEIDKSSSHDRHRIGKVAYVLGLSAVFLIDVPLNSVVFNIFHANPLETLMLAALLGILIVPSAHVLGIQLRNGMRDRIATTIATVVPVLLIIGIAYIRSQYLKELHSQQLTGMSGVLVFTVFNLAIFTSAVFLSYLRHDPHESALEEARAELKKAKTEFDALAARLESLRGEIGSIESRMGELVARADEEFKEAGSHAHSQRNAHERLMHEYCGANKSARLHPDEPIVALERLDKPTVPPDLRRDSREQWIRHALPAKAEVASVTG
jgi:predicted  nucleic acid-binding Zn-ribbon protein